MSLPYDLTNTNIANTYPRLVQYVSGTNTFHDGIGVTLEGFAGSQGPQGLQGLDGVTGPTGNDGLDGPQGPQGSAGTIGIDGVTGPTGNDGLDGPQGPQGSAGTIGIDGVTGPTGPAGINYSYSTKTLVQADWVLNAISGYYEQSITLTGILSTSYVEVIAPTNRDYYNDYVDNQILITSVTADTLIFEAIVEPLADIIIEIRYIV